MNIFYEKKYISSTSPSVLFTDILISLEESWSIICRRLLASLQLDTAGLFPQEAQCDHATPLPGEPVALHSMAFKALHQAKQGTMRELIYAHQAVTNLDIVRHTCLQRLASLEVTGPWH